MTGLVHTAYEDEPQLDPRMQRSRASLREALLDLLEIKSFDRITVREITSRAGVGYATFFRHYPSKEALLSSLAEGQIATLLELIAPALWAEDSRTTCVTLCHHVFQRRSLWTALLTGVASAPVREEFIRQAKLIDLGPIPEDGWVPAELTTICCVGGTLDVLGWWLVQPEPRAPEEVAKMIDLLIVLPALQRSAA